jgi:hypothetical protein
MLFVEERSVSCFVLGIIYVLLVCLMLNYEFACCLFQ